MSTANESTRRNQAKSKDKKRKQEQLNGHAKANAKSKKKSGKAKLTAKTADLYDLYERSVQDPESEVKLLDRTFKKLVGRRPLSLREDFCGTGLLCATWVKSHADRTATGVDLDTDVLESGRTRHIAPLGDDASRVTLLQEDVRARRPERFDIVCAYNFSYWIFTTRTEMVKYFQAACEAVKEDGFFALDAYGGTEAMEAREEHRKVQGGFTYVWDQATFNPIDHYAQNYIHFHFKDGTKLNKAFSYAWRFWSLPEIHELLLEAGFKDVSVLWDIADDDEDSDYRPRKVVENQPSWVCYLIARK
ncbi:MAG: class I SAM-dependent methyltransferase [Polyangiaceae bacterium]|nr:class I SAM-dependent methyltransferase [Myxococcales bacterium]MCB9587227.1 class I SAM-dependent methyltransferase [Polyangiaceae bacterium]MCB9609390.1 class I SAM-dependent methyltransferase [Polyangiaceae bacterium]